MLTFHRQIRAGASVEDVYRFLADFTSINQWDPRAGDATLVDGHGAVGSRYSCLVHFLGRRTRMTYEITELQPTRRIQWSGTTSGAVRAHDVITLHSSAPDETTVDYTAMFEYSGWLGWLTPLLRRPLGRLCDDAQHGLRVALARGSAG